MEELLKQASDIGLKVDKRWSEKRLQQEIETASAEPKETKVSDKTFPVRLNKNYRPVGDFMIERDEDGETVLVEPTDEERLKVSAGTVIHVQVEEARDIIAKKVADRNDPIG